MSTCNTTAAIMVLMASGISFDYPKDMQPEDYLTSILHSEEAYDQMAKKYPWAIRGGYEPNEVHGMLEWGINKLVGTNIDEFTTNGKLSDIVYGIVVRKVACLVSTKFTKAGHIVAVVGVRSEQPIEDYYTWGVQLTKYTYDFIVDDPYGNYHSGYSDRNGDNVVFSYDQFNALTKSSHAENSKWVHRIVV